MDFLKNDQIFLHLDLRYQMGFNVLLTITCDRGGQNVQLAARSFTQLSFTNIKQDAVLSQVTTNLVSEPEG